MHSSPIGTATERGWLRGAFPREAWLFAIGSAFALLVALGGWTFLMTPDNATVGPAATAGTAVFEEATGVQIVRVSLTAGGGMIDLRYRVLDPDKAVTIHDDANPPAIIHEATNRVVNRPFMHHAKAKDLHLAVTYYELLLNTGELIKPGDPVTVVLGGAKLEHVIAQ